MRQKNWGFPKKKKIKKNIIFFFLFFFTKKKKKIKYDTYPYDFSIIITANEINEYFKVLLKSMSLVFPELAQKTKHISHGILRLPEGKMSSRTGNIISAESLIEQVKVKVLEKMKDREMDSETLDKVAEIVAIG